MRIKIAKVLFWAVSVLGELAIVSLVVGLFLPRNSAPLALNAAVTRLTAFGGLALCAVLWLLDREKNVWNGSFLMESNPKLWAAYRKVFKWTFRLALVAILASFAMHTKVKTTYIPAG